MSASARGIALTMHLLRQQAWVQQDPAAKEWLDGGALPERTYLQKTKGLERRLLSCLRLPSLSRLFLQFLQWRFAHTPSHLLQRKLWFLEIAQQQLAQGCQQVLLLGSGLDPLAGHLASRHPQVEFFELDQAAVLACKESQSNLHLLALDLQEADLATDLGAADLTQSLQQQPAFQAQAPTLVLAEALFMYLPEKKVRQILNALPHCCPGPLTLAFSAIDAQALEKPNSGLARVARHLARRNEGFRWTTSPGEIRKILQESYDVTGQTLKQTEYGELFCLTQVSGRAQISGRTQASGRINP